MALLQNWYGNPIVHSIGWVLLHACWQITLVALVLRFLRPTLSRKSANALYLAGITSLLMIALWSVFTFWNQQQHFEEAISIAKLEPFYNNAPATIIAAPLEEPVEISPSQPLEEAPLAITDRLLYYLPVGVVFWFTGVLFFLIRLIAGWLRIYHLRTKDLSVINEQWLNRFEHLKNKLGIHRSIQFFCSGRVEAPLTLGFFKPMILVPVGLFANLSPEMVEMVLLHELAHIKRADYLINILQSVVEMLFFFHPGIWWISKIIRESREHACDDIAVATCQDPMLYANTLTQLQFSFLTSKNNLAMSLTGTTGSFTTRIKRLFGYVEPTQSKNKSVLFSSLLLTCLLFFAFLPSPETDHYPDGLLAADSEAVLYVITPTTTQMQLDNIRTALKSKGITMQISNLEFTAFGLLDNIKLDFELADQRKFMLEAGKLQYIYLTADFSKSDPLDVRFQCSRMTLSPPTEYGDEKTWAMARPYSTSFSIPSFIGDIGFKEENGTEQMILQFDSEDSAPVLLLNGKKISATELLAKDLKPKDITHIRKYSPSQAMEKLNLVAPNGAYRIFAKLDAEGNKRGLFFDGKKNPATQYKFKVLHKAEVRGINKYSPMGIKPNVEYHISADNCEDANKTVHVLNDRILEVPDGACYPPELLALAEVDSFFLYDEDLAQQQYGVKSAYVFYYKHNHEGQKSTVFNFKPKSELSIDRVKMNEVRLEDITTHEKIPKCFLNDQPLAQNSDGSWPEALTQIEVFDSLIILTSADSKQAYGLTSEEDGLLFYYQSDQPDKKESRPIKLSGKTPINLKHPNILYVLNDEVLFTESGRKSPALLEDIPSDGYEKAFYLTGKDATDKYGEAGVNGVIELYTKAQYATKDFSEQIQVSPNPFSNEVNIKIALFKKALVKIIIYDRSGRMVADLTEETLEKGYHTFNWLPDANVPSGTYYITIQRDKDFESIPVVYQSL